MPEQDTGVRGGARGMARALGQVRLWLRNGSEPLLEPRFGIIETGILRIQLVVPGFIRGPLFQQLLLA